MNAVALPIYFDEAEAAKRIGVSRETLARERRAGKVHPSIVGKRIIRYTEAIVQEYMQSCRNDSVKSAATGSANDVEATTGAERGSTQLPDRQSAHRLAQSMLKKRR